MQGDFVKLVAPGGDQLGMVNTDDIFQGLDQIVPLSHGLT